MAAQKNGRRAGRSNFALFTAMCQALHIYYWALWTITFGIIIYYNYNFLLGACSGQASGIEHTHTPIACYLLHVRVRHIRKFEIRLHRFARANTYLMSDDVQRAYTVQHLVGCTIFHRAPTSSSNLCIF